MGEITCHSEDWASQDSQENQKRAILRSVAGVIDLSVYKHQASDGNEKSKPGINVLQFSFSVNYVPFF